ncbi:MAG: cupin domain-containing protein [Pseudomonadota bacterium]
MPTGTGSKLKTTKSLDTKTGASRTTRAASKKLTGTKPSSSGIEPAEIKIGMRLKHGRLVKGLRLTELADLLDCSESYLSKVENNKVRPSLSMLHRIVGALGMNISQLFSDTDDTGGGQIQIVRANERSAIRTHPIRKGSGVTLERLIATSRESLLESNIHCVEPGGHTDGFITHDGEEIGYVIEGQIDIQLDGNWYSLKEGDSFFFRSNLPHGYRNSSKKVARVLWVNTPLTF